MNWIRKAILSFLFPVPVIRFKMGVGACPPSRGHEDDAGWDLYNSTAIFLEAHSFTDVGTGIYADIPEGHWIRITGRSSTVRKWKVQVQEGIIDEGYTGELFIGVWNLTDKVIAVPQHTRLAQMIVNKANPVVWQVGEIREKNRGNSGFGSTGS